MQIDTRKPEFDELRGRVELTSGNRSLFGLAAEVTGALPVQGGDVLAFRLGAFREDEDSFRFWVGIGAILLTLALTPFTASG